ncbi:DUF6078 family protein [Bacteroidales bacterium OttesenSCG-928-M06]|nr:DUF6078 family protein [Bacteroidales bacterium OttesenSCG-928-M06]
MKKDINYKEVPRNFLHCLNTECNQAKDCLRFKVGIAANEDVPHYSMINPAYVKKQGTCRFFEPVTIVRYALGITHLYDNLPHTKYLRIKTAIHKYLEHNRYYRIYNRLYLITPEQQEFIRDVFRKEGIETEPIFDEYIEQYNFSIRATLDY